MTRSPEEETEGRASTRFRWARLIGGCALAALGAVLMLLLSQTPAQARPAPPDGSTAVKAQAAEAETKRETTRLQNRRAAEAAQTKAEAARTKAEAARAQAQAAAAETKRETTRLQNRRAAEAAQAKTEPAQIQAQAAETKRDTTVTKPPAVTKPAPPPLRRVPPELRAPKPLTKAEVKAPVTEPPTVTMSEPLGGSPVAGAGAVAGVVKIGLKALPKAGTLFSSAGKGISKAGSLLRIGSKTPQVSRVLVRSEVQLQKKFKHGGDFGVSVNYSKANAALFSAAVHRHINHPGVRVIRGTYHDATGKIPVIHYLDPVTAVNVIATRSGTFISGFKLNPSQLSNVLRHGHL